jgi:pimeloyl-ACP methyl ester carboxylesterase
MSKLQLVRFTSSDTLLLPGLLYTPEQPTDEVALWLHGMGDNGIFYSPLLVNALGHSLTAHNIALFAFNNRGAHNMKILKIDDKSLPEDERSYLGGTYYEKIADCVYDINGAVAYLKTRGFSKFSLMGHSTGANKICAYHMRVKQNPFRKYLLAGPGDDSGLLYIELGEKKFWKALALAKKFLAVNQPMHIMPKVSGMHPFSAQAAADILDPDGPYNTFPFYEATKKRLGHKPLFQEFKKIDRQTLIIFGQEDEYTLTTAGGANSALRILREKMPKVTQAKSEFKLIEQSDHSFHGAETEFAETVTAWLRQ